MGGMKTKSLGWGASFQLPYQCCVIINGRSPCCCRRGRWTAKRQGIYIRPHEQTWRINLRPVQIFIDTRLYILSHKRIGRAKRCVSACIIIQLPVTGSLVPSHKNVCHSFAQSPRRHVRIINVCHSFTQSSGRYVMIIILHQGG